MNKGYEKVKDILIQCSRERGVLFRKKYDENPKKCLYCGKILEYRKGINKIKFCNKSCSASYNNKNKPHRSKITKCPVCGKSFRGRYNKVFCSNKCFAINKSNVYLNLWLLGDISGLSGEQVANYVKRYLVSTRGEKCEKCGWNETNLVTGKIPITINHIDGNYENNVPENLELLCPNCHSLTSNYGSLNKGNGRKIRRLKRNAELV